ncbi:hypothetical protein Hanom_Chr15g01343221 [Helianthus anomalus]
MSSAEEDSGYSNDENDRMSEDTEEGEFRPETEKEVGGEKAGNEKTPEGEKSSFGIPEHGVHDLHGEVEVTDQSPSSNNETVGPKEVSGEELNNGPCVTPLVNTVQQPNGPSMDLGPTPFTALGKRPRNFRSSPSTGSMQGPPTRLSCHRSSDDCSFDLNTSPGFNQNSGIQSNMEDPAQTEDPSAGSELPPEPPEPAGDIPHVADNSTSVDPAVVVDLEAEATAAVGLKVRV